MAGGNMDVKVTISAVDRYSKEIETFERHLRDLDRHAGRGFQRPGDRPGAAYGRHVGATGARVAQAEHARAAASGAPGMTPMGLPVGLLGAGAAGLGAREVVSAAADFESSLTGIQKKSGATNEQMRAIGEEIKSIATDGSLAVSIDEIASAYERGAASGLPLDKLRDFATLTTKGADAFEMSAADVANASAGFNKVLDVPLEGMERYFDLINGLADSGIADESGIVTYIDQAGAMAKTFGLTAEQIAAVGAALNNLKVDSGKAATATNAIFAKLTAPDSMSGPARQAFSALIKDTGKFQKLVADGKGQEAFLQVIDALQGMDKAKRTGIIVDLFGQDHLDVMQQLVAGAAELKRNLAFAGGTDWFGSLGKSYALKIDDFWSQWQILKNEIASTVIDVGTAGMPALKIGLETIRSTVREIGDGFESLTSGLDWESIGRAQTAIGELKGAIVELLGMDTSQSAIAVFFKDLARLINEIADAINKIEAKIQAVRESAVGQVLFGDEKQREEGAQRLGTTIDPETGRLKKVPFKPGGLVPGFTEWTAEQSGAGMRTDSQVEADKTGRVGKSPDTVVQERFGDALAPLDPAVVAAFRERASQPIVLPPPALNLPDIASVPIPTLRPDIDTSAFLEKTNTMQTALASLDRSVTPTVDVNIAPALAKLATLREDMARTAMNVSAMTHSEIDRANPGSRFNARVNDQF